MDYFMLLSLAIISGTLGQICNYSGFTDCVLQPSILNYTQKISSPNFFKTLNPQDAVDKHCSFQWKLVSCLQDMKRSCVSTNSLSLPFDMLISAVKYLCTVGKQGFIDNFQCLMNNFVVDRTSLQSCKKFFPELMEIKNRKTGSDVSSEKCRVLEKLLTCIDNKAKNLCGGKAATYIRSYLEASFKPLTEGVTCNNSQTTTTHWWTFVMMFVTFSICLFNVLYDFL
ncbi:uncharacterized protein LOC133201767 [Saccostrea echinata]|uniref:uncharacterized protein LOC133201767 n=1 Tax=Saccostrea echinata TaxID=191078 RepID=UPI002A812201|nr:uncharacterized protein LOC133201767 [Saccostrea echinata]